MSNVIKMQPGSIGPGPSALPDHEEFVSFADFWQRVGEPTSGQEAGPAAAEQAPPRPRDPREIAREQAAEIIRQAREEAARLQQEAREKGKVQGEKEGRSKGEKEYAARIRQLEQVAGALRDLRREIFDRYQEELLTLVKSVSERLVRHEVSVNPLVIRACFKEAMTFVVENSLVKAHISPDDFHHLKEAGLADPSLFEGKNRVQLVEDPTISPGGCLLKSSFGEIDATLENGREKLYEAVDCAFMAALAGAGTEEPPPLPDSPPERSRPIPAEASPELSTEPAAEAAAASPSEAATPVAEPEAELVAEPQSESDPATAPEAAAKEDPATAGPA